MKTLLKRARGIFLALLVVYVVGFGAGVLAEKLKAVDTAALRKSRLVEFNRNLEFKVPVYGDALKRYKSWHTPLLGRLLAQKNATGLGLLVFINNFAVANFTMAVRAATLVPMIFYPLGRFVQGASIVQSSGSSRFVPLLFMEFGGYFLVIGAVLCAWVWTLWPRRYGFASRKDAFLGGLKLLGVLWLVSGLFIAAGAVLEARLMLGLVGG